MSDPYPFLPSHAERASILAQAASLVNAHWETMPTQPIGPVLNDEAIAAAIAGLSFEAPTALSEVLERCFELFALGMLRGAHPRNFGLFIPTPSLAGVVGELIAAALNSQLAACNHAPAAVAAEKAVVEALGKRFGFRESFGHFTSGGSEANMTAALVSLTSAFPSYSEQGLASLAHTPVFYVSADSHAAWFKIAHQLGLGRAAVRLVATDGSGRMDASALEWAIRKDRADGLAPFMVGATAGTTNAGMIDPLSHCADIAVEHSLWLHVDAAWGGGAVASETARKVLDGIERADSLTVDAHKFLSVPIGAGIFICRHNEPLSQAFRAQGSYMPSARATEDPYLLSAQWSRRFSGLKLFLSLASSGWAGHGAAVDNQLLMAAELKDILRANGFQVFNESSLGVVCFLPREAEDPDDLVTRLQADQAFWISAADFEGQRVLRACVTSFRTQRSDIHALVRELCALIGCRE